MVRRQVGELYFILNLLIIKKRIIVRRTVRSTARPIKKGHTLLLVYRHTDHGT